MYTDNEHVTYIRQMFQPADINHLIPKSKGQYNLAQLKRDVIQTTDDVDVTNNQ